jgi:hypothetical protein
VQLLAEWGFSMDRVGEDSRLIPLSLAELEKINVVNAVFK